MACARSWMRGVRARLLSRLRRWVDNRLMKNRLGGISKMLWLRGQKLDGPVRHRHTELRRAIRIPLQRLNARVAVGIAKRVPHDLFVVARVIDEHVCLAIFRHGERVVPRAELAVPRGGYEDRL